MYAVRNGVFRVLDIYIINQAVWLSVDIVTQVRILSPLPSELFRKELPTDEVGQLLSMPKSEQRDKLAVLQLTGRMANGQISLMLRQSLARVIWVHDWPRSPRHSTYDNPNCFNTSTSLAWPVLLMNPPLSLKV